MAHLSLLLGTAHSSLNIVAIAFVVVAVIVLVVMIGFFGQRGRQRSREKRAHAMTQVARPNPKHEK
jgi:uncharacterized membrane protein